MTPDVYSSLFDWHKENKRDFPWRSARDPYDVLIAEKLLQQTHASKRVVDAYTELIRQFPSALELSQADLRVIKRIFQPLGLVYRAKELKHLGKVILKNYNAKLPNDLNGLLGLPGIGDYIARAILSFAFGNRVPIVDTNVARFLYRYFGIQDPLPANPARSKKILQYAEQLLPVENFRMFNFALLDLCASVCIWGKPKCELCPISNYCLYPKTH